MLGRMDLEYKECPTCKGTGKSKKKRTKPCDTCGGNGKTGFCKTCKGMYGTGCVDAPGVLDQTYCTGHSLEDSE